MYYFLYNIYGHNNNTAAAARLTTYSFISIMKLHVLLLCLLQLATFKLSLAIY